MPSVKVSSMDKFGPITAHLTGYFIKLGSHRCWHTKFQWIGEITKHRSLTKSLLSITHSNVLPIINIKLIMISRISQGVLALGNKLPSRRILGGMPTTSNLYNIKSVSIDKCRRFSGDYKKAHMKVGLGLLVNNVTTV
jgi:hypothetical protein